MNDFHTRRKSVRIVAMLLIAAATTLAGCKKQKLANDQIVGVWQIEDLDAFAAKPEPSLSLDANGKFIATSLPPGIIQTDGPSPPKAVSGTGTWSLVRRNGENRVQINFAQMNGASATNGADLLVENSGSDLRLSYDDGDPDEDERISFKRLEAGH